MYYYNIKPADNRSNLIRLHDKESPRPENIKSTGPIYLSVASGWEIIIKSFAATIASARK